MPSGANSIFSTTALIFTAYLGFVQIANIGAEVKKPSTNLPRSLIGSVVIAMSLYAFIMFACIVTFPQEELKKFGETATIEVARKMLGNKGAIIVLFGGILAALSSANASMISASRSVYAISKDQLISKKVSIINKRFGTPHVILILITVPIAIILIRSRIEIFAEVASFLHLFIYAGICFSVLKLRLNNPNWYIPTFRIPMFKIVAGLGGISCMGLVFFMQKLSILISIIILAFLYYILYVKRKEIILSNPNPPHVDFQVINPAILIPIDVSKEKKDIPSPILKAIPISDILLLGYRETPEQTEAEQSEKEFSKEGKEKLERIESQMKEANYDFNSELIFGNEILDQLVQLIDENEFQIILALKPHTTLNEVVIPIHDLTQINTKLSTLMYNLKTQNQIKTKVILFVEGGDDSYTEAKFKRAIENQFSDLKIPIQDYEVVIEEDLSPNTLIRKVTLDHASDGDLVIWSEAVKNEREDFLNFILENESENIKSPIIMILNKEGDKGK